MKRIFSCVGMIFMLLHITSAFVTPATRSVFAPRPITGIIMKNTGTRRSTPLMLFKPLRNLWAKVKDKVRKADAELERKADELMDKAQKSIRDFDVYLTQAIENKSAEVTQDVAVEFVSLLKGSWDVMVGVNDTDTAAAMDGTLNAVSETVVSVLGDKEGDKDVQLAQVKEELASYRLRIENIIDATVYPLRLELQVYMGKELQIRAFGQLTFDVLKHTLDFVLDKLIVFDVQVDLASVLEAANAAEDDGDIDASEADAAEAR